MDGVIGVSSVRRMTSSSRLEIAVAGTMTERVVIDLLQPAAHKLFSRLYRRSEGQTIAVDLGTPDAVSLFGLVWAVLICVIKEIFSCQFGVSGN